MLDYRRKTECLVEGEEEAVDVRYRNTRPGYVRIGKENIGET